MQPVIQDFISWFCRFVMVSAVLLVAVHLFAERRRAKLKAKDKLAQPQGGMKAIARSSNPK